MATHVRASAVFDAPIEEVWKHLRGFTFPCKLISGITQCTMLEGATPTTVGAVREMHWASGEMRKHRLLCCDDYHYRLIWELLETVPESETVGAVSELRLVSITEQHHTLVEWSVDFSADVKPETIKFEQKSLQTNLGEMRTKIKHC